MNSLRASGVAMQLISYKTNNPIRKLLCINSGFPNGVMNNYLIFRSGSALWNLTVNMQNVIYQPLCKIL